MSTSSVQDVKLSVDRLDDDNIESKTRLRLWLHLLKATKEIEGELRERLRQEFNTTLPRFDVMAALYRFENGLKMSEISGVLKVSNGNVTGIVDRLTDEGLLVRVPVKGDRRALLVKLTQKGREQFGAMAVKHESWVNEVLSAISAVDGEELVEQLELLLPKSATDEGEIHV
ncbi:MAG: MarR family transcriptional regulator [Arenicellales bacterium]